MKKDRVRISLDVSPELAEKLKAESDKKDITLNATIRLILQQYFENSNWITIKDRPMESVFYYFKIMFTF